MLEPEDSDAPLAGRRKPGRPVTLDSDAVGEIVADLGFRDLTFAVVADRLGVSPATLYRHVPNRDMLVRLGLDVALRRIDWPSLDGPWDALLRRWAIASWRAWETYPGAVMEVSRGVVPTAMIALADRIGVRLIELGLTPTNAVLAVDLVFDLAADNRRGMEQLAELTDPGDDGRVDVRAALAEQWSGAETGDSAADRPVTSAEQAIRTAMTEAIRADPIDWFVGKLDVVLSGIGQRLVASSGAHPATEDRHNI